MAYFSGVHTVAKSSGKKPNPSLPGGAVNGHARDSGDQCVRIFSDFHLGHSGSLISQVSQLAPLLEGADIAIFNGDTIEERCPSFRSRGLEMLSELNELCVKMGARPVYLSGNHDPETWSDLWLDLCGSDVFVTHGHALLKYISPWSREAGETARKIDELWSEFDWESDSTSLEDRLELTRRCCQATAVFEPELKKSLLANAMTIAGELWPPARPISVLRTWFGVPDDARDFARKYRPEARFFVMGHTHFPGIWRRGELTVVNTGAFFVALNARMVEIREGELSVHTIKRGGGGDFVRGTEKGRFSVPVTADCLRRSSSDASVALSSGG